MAEEGSFNRAADILARSQPAVTLAIKQLEEFIGLKLLERTSRRVVPTTEGEDFFPVAKRLVRNFDTAIRDLRATAERRSGHVSLAVLPSIANNLLPNIIKRFNTDFPGISVDLHDDNSQGVQRRVERNEVDFGLGSLWRPSEQLSFTKIMRDTFTLVCHRDHPLGEATTPLPWSALADTSFLHTGISGDLPIKAYFPEPKLQFPNITTLLAMLRANLGVTALPTLAIANIGEELTSRALVDPVATRDIYLITRRDDSLSLAAEAMLGILADQIPSTAIELGLDVMESFAGIRA